MKRRSFRRISTFFITAVLSLLLFGACQKKETVKKLQAETLVLWYTQSSMKDYLERAASAYKEQYHVSVSCVYKDSGSYMEEMYQAGMNGEEAPDVYLLRNDKLGRVCMEGLAAANTSKVYNESNYCSTALEAAEYKSVRMAYPLYFNTVCMIYNTDYLQSPPSTMGAVTAFSETAELSGDVQYIFYWDITDYLCNYSFLGQYLDIGGNSGDDRSSRSIFNEQTTACLQQFQQLGQYFAIDSTALQPEDIPLAFMEGRTICILADCDMVHLVDWYTINYGLQRSYQICAVPDVSDELKSRSGSYTELAVVSGMSTKQEAAAGFARFLTYDYADVLYDISGHIPAKREEKYSNAEFAELYKVYEQSRPLPKLLETEDLSVHLEVLFANVQKGLDIAAELQNFDQKMELRMNK